MVACELEGRFCVKLHTFNGAILNSAAIIDRKRDLQPCYIHSVDSSCITWPHQCWRCTAKSARTQTICHACSHESAPFNDLLQKELQYFNRWPLPHPDQYLRTWHSGVVGAMFTRSAGRRVLLDASSQYLMTAAAPPRIKAIVPHAKFVMVVRVCPVSSALRNAKLCFDHHQFKNDRL
jgi:hypothetical protein